MIRTSMATRTSTESGSSCPGVAAHVVFPRMLPEVPGNPERRLISVYVMVSPSTASSSVWSFEASKVPKGDRRLYSRMTSRLSISFPRGADFFVKYATSFDAARFSVDDSSELDAVLLPLRDIHFPMFNTWARAAVSSFVKVTGLAKTHALCNSYTELESTFSQVLTPCGTRGNTTTLHTNSPGLLNSTSP